MYENKIPVTILTGFLGSGKTTLLDRILKDNHNLKIAVLVNDFGEINIDSQLLQAVEQEMILLSNGCICCTINQNLNLAVTEVLNKQDIDYIIIETSGLAEPLPLMMTFLTEPLTSKTRLDAIITLVDAENFQPEKMDAIALQQIIYGDVILLNKIDLVTKEKLDNLEAYINTIKPNSRIIQTQKAQVDLALILSLNLEKKIELNSHSYKFKNESYQAYSWQSDRPLNIALFTNFINNLPSNIIRGKGILWYQGSQLCHKFQLCGTRIDWQTDTWSKPPSNQLVLIGKDLDNTQIEQQLKECLNE